MRTEVQLEHDKKIIQPKCANERERRLGQAPALAGADPTIGRRQHNQQHDQKCEGFIRSFVHHERALNSKQEKLFGALWQKYGIDVEVASQRISALLRDTKPINLEIGFGHGEALLQMAQNNPEQIFLGIEVYRTGIYRLMQLLAKENINNVFLLHADSQNVLTHSIPNQALSAIFIFFPDPWPKRRHHKRRLLQAPFLKLVLQKLKPGGFTHFATDDANYAEEVRALFASNPQLQKTDRHAIAENFARPITKFARRAAQSGCATADLVVQLLST